MAFRSISPDYPTSHNSQSSTPAEKRPTHCTKCGSKVAGHDKFCSNCGAQIVPISRPKDSCPCGTIFNPGNKFCATCGRANPNPVPSKPPAKRAKRRSRQ